MRLPRFGSPSSDNERLLTYQARWLEDGDEGARSELWALALEVAGRCCRGDFFKRRVRPSPEELEDCAMEAVLYVMGRYASPMTYKRLPSGEYVRCRDVYGWNYCVTKDYVSVLAQAAKHAIDYRTKADKLVDFVSQEAIDVLAAGEEA